MAENNVSEKGSLFEIYSGNNGEDKNYFDYKVGAGKTNPPLTGLLSHSKGIFDQLWSLKHDQESGDLVDDEINYLTKRFEYEMDKEKLPEELLSDKKEGKEKKEKEEEGKKPGLEDLVKQIEASQKGRSKEEKEKVYEGVKRGLSGGCERDFSNFEKYAPLFVDSQERDADLFRYVGELSNDKLSPEARGELMGMLVRSEYDSNKALKEGQLGDNLKFTEDILDNFENYEKL